MSENYDFLATGVGGAKRDRVRGVLWSSQSLLFFCAKKV
jgi:hypothetical protein